MSTVYQENINTITVTGQEFRKTRMTTDCLIPSLGARSKVLPKTV